MKIVSVSLILSRIHAVLRNSSMSILTKRGRICTVQNNRLMSKVMWQIRHFKTVTYISGRSQMKLKYSKAKTEQQFWSRGNSELFKNVSITCNEALQLKSHGPWCPSLGKLFCTESGCTVSSVTVCSLRSRSLLTDFPLLY